MRLFVALDLPSQPVAALQDFAATAARDGLRLLPPESLHVTLAFLGEQPDPDAVADALRCVPRSQPFESLEALERQLRRMDLGGRAPSLSGR